MSTFFSPVSRQKPLGTGDKAKSTKSRAETTVWASILLVSGTVFLAAAFSLTGNTSSDAPSTPSSPTTITPPPPPTTGPPAGTPSGSTTTTTAAPETTTTQTSTTTTRHSTTTIERRVKKTTTTPPTTTPSPTTTADTRPPAIEGHQPGPTDTVPVTSAAFVDSIVSTGPGLLR